MKFNPKHYSFFLIILFFLMMAADVSGCFNVIQCKHSEDALKNISNRKVLLGKVEIAGAGTGHARNNTGRKLVRVPSGPDPLHHNGILPKKPGNL